MKQVDKIQNPTAFNRSIEHLLATTKKWISEIEFIKVEQDFLKELVKDHIILFCTSDNFKKAKLMLRGLNNENTLSKKLMKSVIEHKVNLALLIENIYLKNEDAFRKNHEYLKSEVQNYIENFKQIKKQIFELTLLLRDKKNKQKLL